MGSRILVMDGHPDRARERFCHALAEAYIDGARSTGKETRLITVSEAEFSPLRTATEFGAEPADPLIVRAREDILWSDHLVLIFPLWLGGAPALLRGFFEQVARSGFVADISKYGVAQKLKGRSARLIVTMGAPAPLLALMFHERGKGDLMHGVLGLGGVAPIKRTLFGPIEATDERTQQGRLEKVRRLGRDGD